MVSQVFAQDSWAKSLGLASANPENSTTPGFVRLCNLNNHYEKEENTKKSTNLLKASWAQ